MQVRNLTFHGCAAQQDLHLWDDGCRSRPIMSMLVCCDICAALPIAKLWNDGCCSGPIMSMLVCCDHSPEAGRRVARLSSMRP